MSERPTPETDSQPLYDETEGGIRESINGQYVDADFARNLERQRDALLEALEELYNAPWFSLPGRAGEIVENAIAKTKGGKQ